jgi:hypothetical protein
MSACDYASFTVPTTAILLGLGLRMEGTFDPYHRALVALSFTSPAPSEARRATAGKANPAITVSAAPAERCTARMIPGDPTSRRFRPPLARQPGAARVWVAGLACGRRGRAGSRLCSVLPRQPRPASGGSGQGTSPGSPGRARSKRRCGRSRPVRASSSRTTRRIPPAGRILTALRRSSAPFSRPKSSAAQAPSSGRCERPDQVHLPVQGTPTQRQWARLIHRKRNWLKP